MTTKQTELYRMVTKVEAELANRAFLDRLASRYVLHDQRIAHLPYQKVLRRHYITVFARLLEIFTKEADHVGWRPATGAYNKARLGLKPEKAMVKVEFEKVFLTAIDNYLKNLLEEVNANIEREKRTVLWARMKESSFSYMKEFLSSNLVVTELSAIAHGIYANALKNGSRCTPTVIPQAEFVKGVKDVWLKAIPGVEMDKFTPSMTSVAEKLLNSHTVVGYHEGRAAIKDTVQYCDQIMFKSSLGLLATLMKTVVGLKGVKDYLETERGYSWLEVNLRLLGFGVSEDDIKVWTPAIRSYLLDLVDIRFMGGGTNLDRSHDRAREVHLVGLEKASDYGFAYLRHVDDIEEGFIEIMAQAEHRTPPVELTPVPLNSKPFTPSEVREIVQTPSFTLTMSELSRLMKLSKLPDNLDPRSTVRLIRNGQGDLQFMIDL